jgi:hypothetical protein
MMQCALAARLPWVSTTPLGREVLPDVTERLVAAFPDRAIRKHIDRLIRHAQMIKDL